MNGNADGEGRDLLAHVLLPVAHEEDALATATELEPCRPDRVTVLHVVEKGEGVPDETPIIQSETIAAESYAAVRSASPTADDHVVYARDVVGTIIDAAAEVGASAIAYRSRVGGRIMQFLSGDLSLKLVTNADRPVIALHRVDTDE